MFESVTQTELRARMEQHLLMVEVQGLERRIARIEEGLGLEPQGVSASGWVAGRILKSETARGIL